MILRSLFLLCMFARGLLTVNRQPVIGILLQENRGNDTRGDTYVMFDYIEYIHAAGALAVPIRVKESQAYYEDMFSKINGVLFPGGGVSILTSEYARAGKILLNLAIEANKKGDYFPVWGTCLGSELLIQTAVGDENVYISCDAEDIHLALNLLPDANDSKVLRDIDPDDLYSLTHDPITANYHQYCLTPQVYNKNELLKNFYRSLATNIDRKEVEFVSLFEARDYPIYGSQFHPEKNPYYWRPDHHVNHSYPAVKVSQYFGSFLVKEARKNGHRYPDNETLSQDLFYNYDPVYLVYPAMYSNYYFNYTTESSILNDNVFSFWTEDKFSITCMVFNAWVFFFLGASFVFFLDYLLGIRRTVLINSSELSANELKTNLLVDASDVKVPL